MSLQADAIDRILSGVRVMPVVVIEKTAHAAPLARALMDGGIKGIEVTLRTPVALEAVKTILAEVPEMTVGTGTVLSPNDFDASAEAGAAFAVSPGLTDELARSAASLFSQMPLLPGTATASEVMKALDHGFERLKLFPAEAVGGLNLIKSLASPLPRAKFCPTGGITEKTAPDYLAQANIFCVGGSWLTPKALMEEGDWGEITRRAKIAAVL